MKAVPPRRRDFVRQLPDSTAPWEEELHKIARSFFETQRTAVEKIFAAKAQRHEEEVLIIFV